MELQTFLSKVPYLYHLTDRQNLTFIRHHNKLFSTVELVGMGPKVKETFLQNRRGEHAELLVGEHAVKIRDQKPLTRALARALRDGWTTEKWIYHLNSRVFTWPNLKRLRAHFKTYAKENPTILRFVTTEALALNQNVELCRINSGDSRCIGGIYKGNPVPRGKDTFQSIADYDFIEIAEVTFPSRLMLPETWHVADNPNGPWEAASSSSI